MRILNFAVFLLLFSCGFAISQMTPAADNPPAPAKIPSFDAGAVDKAADPCVDFYQYACGNWMKQNPIPGDQSRWGQFGKLQQNNELILLDILKKVSEAGTRTPVERQVGDYFAACMDTKAIAAAGTKPLQPELKRIAEIRDKKQLAEVIARLHEIGARPLFNFYSQPDMHDATMQIAYLDQGGISLPDRDYYLKDTGIFPEARKRYVSHVQKMFELLGDRSAAAAKEAQTVLTIETALAKASMDRTERRNPKNRDHRMPLSEIAAAAPNFDLATFLQQTKAPSFATLNVVHPPFFKEVNQLLDTTPLADWKVYLRWRLVHAAAPLLSDAFVNEDFGFYAKYLRGQQEIAPRWKRCVQYTDDELGEALGQLYVERAFGKDSKERTHKMVQAIEASMHDDIVDLPWMAEETKKAALVKLQAIVNNIGYPDKWRDYSSVKIARNDALNNSFNATQFESHRIWNRIGKPVDRKEWSMTPPTVNAYYSPARNDINFPAGILQSPFYAPDIDDAVNYGGIGVVIGHELTHGFDDQGRKFDANGNLRDWWTAKDGEEFEARASCIADEYGNFTAVKDEKGEVKLNGRLTLGENTADNGGLRIAYAALMKMLSPEDQAKTTDGYTPSQRFFLSYAQIWCQNVTPQESRQRALTDPHSPGMWRVNGAVQNSEEFHKAFGCKKGQPMSPAKTCRVW